MKDFLNDDLFPSFLTSGEVENLNNISVMAESYALRDHDTEWQKIKGKRSNWSSELFQGSMTLYENLNNISNQALEFGNFVARVHNLNLGFNTIKWWVNINPQYSYCPVHADPKTDMTIIYYVKLNEQNPGDLVFMRNDGAVHLDLFTKQPNGLVYPIRPVVGRLYAFPSNILRYEQTNPSEEDRISIVFNLTV